MKMNIALLNESDLDKVDDLGKRFRKTIGFLTQETLLEYLRRNRVLGAWTESGDLTGYLLFADYPDRFRIAQLCVNEDFRGQGVARSLLDALKARANQQKVIKLRCRRDFPAHHMWPKLGFIPLEEKAGRSSDGHPLTLWCFRLDQDDELGLWKAEEIQALTGLRVIHPAELIITLHEETERQSYSPARVSGMGLTWKRLAVGEFEALPLSRLCNEGENKGKLGETVRSYLSRPEEFRCELLRSNGEPIAIRVLGRADSKKLSVPLARVDHSIDLSLFGQFAIADTLSVSVAECREMVEFERENLSQHLEPLLLKMGFIEEADRFVRFTLSSVLTQSEAIDRLSLAAPSLKTQFDAFSGLSLEQHCAPLVSQKDIPCFLVPIQPTFAMGLLDRAQSADDLFGGDPSVLLRWENVYYRKKSCHKMLRAPARILWYVSGKEGAVVALSHLDSVEVDVPKQLFRKYQKFGILEWEDVFEFCGKDITKDIMALKFSRTFMCRHRVTLQELRAVFQSDGIGESLQSPSSIPFEAFTKLFQLGFPNNP